MLNRDICKDYEFRPYSPDHILGQGTVSEVRRIKAQRDVEQGVTRCCRTFRWHCLNEKKEFGQRDFSHVVWNLLTLFEKADHPSIVRYHQYYHSEPD